MSASSSLSLSDADLYAVFRPDDPTGGASFPCQNASSAEYFSESPGGDALVIAGLDYAKTPWVLIYTTSGSALPAVYDIVADYAQLGRTKVAMSLPVSESLYGAISGFEEDVWAYYETTVPSDGSLTLTIRRMQGAPVLYAQSVTGEVPTRDVYTDTNLGDVNDFLIIQQLEAGTKVYIGVYAQMLSTFLLSASFIASDAAAPSEGQRLVAGIPFTGRLTGAAGEAAYFYFPLTTGSATSITVYLDVTSLSAPSPPVIGDASSLHSRSSFPCHVCPSCAVMARRTCWCRGISSTRRAVSLGGSSPWLDRVRCGSPPTTRTTC